MSEAKDLEIGRRAIEKGLLSPEDFETALRRREEDPPFGDLLVKMGFLTRENIRTLRGESGAARALPETPVPLPGARGFGLDFGKYVLLGELGRGGMGVVYRAWDRDLGRLVAIKCLLEAGDEATSKRFHREAQTAAKLSHPNIVPIHDVGLHDGKPFFAMKYIEGEPLNRLRLDPGQAVELTRDAALAVHYAHGEGVVHRDLKPHNLMRDREGKVWVTDFGIARQTKEGATLTETGMVLGTPAYMAPEQALGGRCDARSDVYSLGATLYQLLTGGPPFEAPQPVEVLCRVLNEEPEPPRKRNPRIHPEVQTIVLKAMDRRPERRYVSARELADDISRHLRGEPILAKPATLFTRLAKRIRRHPAMSALTATVVIGACAAAGYAGWSRYRLASEIADLRRTAEDRERTERYDEAIKALQSIAAKDPHQEWAHAKIREMELRRDAKRRADEEGRRRTRARDLLVRADAARRRYESARSEEDFENLTVLLVRAHGEGVRPESEEARRRLADLYWAEFERAERTGDEHAQATYARLVRQYDDEKGSMAARISAPGTLLLESVPPGARVTLYSHVPDGDGRRVARPIDGHRLAPGSYLAVLEKEGYPPVRYPILLRRGEAHRSQIKLYRAEEIGEGYVYVPAGRFVLGGDPRAYRSEARNGEANTPGFFLKRFEVTMGEYAGFLNALLKEGKGEEARSRVPREGSRGSAFWTIPADAKTTALPKKIDPKWPVFGISWEDATAYCVWLSRARKGIFRLPTSAEWEKAARGADARAFPWGDRFDWSFTKGAKSTGDRLYPEPVGKYRADVSPYGVRDLAGGVREWCADVFDRDTHQMAVRGGGWALADPTFFRAASRDGFLPNFAQVNLGLRPVKVPER